MNKFLRYFRKTTVLFTILSVLILISWIADTSSAADRDKEYVAKQITNFKVDGNIREWDRAEVVSFDQLKDAGSSSNTEWIVVKNGNDYIYEVVLDPTKQRGPNPGNDNKGKDFSAKDGLTVGFSFHMNDCENGRREHQIGWIAGQAWNPLSFGGLTFDKEFLDVEPSGKIALTWAAIKR